MPWRAAYAGRYAARVVLLEEFECVGIWKDRPAELVLIRTCYERAMVLLQQGQRCFGSRERVWLL